MTRMIVAAMAAALLSGSAMAQEPGKPVKKRQPAVTTGQQLHPDAARNDPRRNDPNAVFYGGTYLGSDPDPNVRAMMLREGPSRNGTNE